MPISPLPIFFAEGRGTPRPQSPRLPRSSLPVFFQGTVRANGGSEELEIWQADVSCQVLPLYQISWPSDHSFYRLPGPDLPSPGPSRSFSPRTAAAIGLLRLGRRGLFPGHSLQGRYGQTERGRNSKFCRQMCPVTIYLSTKFHDHPMIPSIGFPVSIFPLPVPPDLFGRGPRGLSASSALAAAASSPVFFSWTARANGERERAAILHPDPSGQQLQHPQVSLRSAHFFNRLPPPYLFSPGFPDLFHRGPRSFHWPFRPKTIK